MAVQVFIASCSLQLEPKNRNQKSGSGALVTRRSGWWALVTLGWWALVTRRVWAFVTAHLSRLSGGHLSRLSGGHFSTKWRIPNPNQSLQS